MPIFEIGICIVLIYALKKKWWSLPLIAFLGAFISETILTSIQYTRDWGDGFGFQILVYSFYVLIGYGLIKLKEWMRQKEEAEIAEDGS